MRLPDRLRRRLDDFDRRRRLDDFLAQDAERIFFPEREYTPLRYEHSLLRTQGPRFFVAHFLPR